MSAAPESCPSCGVPQPGASCPACAPSSGAPEIAGYDLLVETAKGGMGVVYRGRQRATGRTVAIKVLSAALASDETAVRRFETEGQALAALSHPGIVRFFEARKVGGRQALVMEWVEGEPLARRVKAGRLPVRGALELTLELLDVLAHAHQRGVVHRDVQPENVLVTVDDHVKLTDFGLALFLSRHADGESRVTRDHARLGSFDYMAPEQRQDSAHVDHRADLYAVGALLYELLVGQAPMGRFMPPSHRSADCPAGVDGVVMRALEADPGRRWSSAREMRDALAEAAGMVFESRYGSTLGTVERELGPMVPVSAGPFRMGPPSREQTLVLPLFLIDKHPVTNAQYRKFVEATGHPEPRYWLDAFRPDVPVDPQMPVVGVGWHDASAFAAWAGKRLPTEAEWEKAARGGDGRRYPWGDVADPSRCNCRETGPRRIAEPGMFPSGASPSGAEDLLGNVLEWTASLDDPYPYGVDTGREDPARHGRRVMRGGSWYSPFSELAVWERYPEIPDTRMPNVGFRCASGPSSEE